MPTTEDLYPQPDRPPREEITSRDGVHPMSRTSVRSAGAPEWRIGLLEDDVDKVEDNIRSRDRRVYERLDKQDREIEELTKELRDAVSDNRKILVGVLVALATASILLAVNILVLSGGPS